MYASVCKPTSCRCDTLRPLFAGMAIILFAAGAAVAQDHTMRPVTTQPTETAAPIQSMTPAEAVIPAAAPATTGTWLRVTGDQINIRSRADLNSRIVGRVARDTALETTGREDEWYRIVPPPGVYSVVASEYIRRIDQTTGIVNVDTTLRVRVGSDVQPRDPMVSEPQTRLENGARVTILGELDQTWLKIKPPPDVFVYISSDYVEPISEQTARQLLESAGQTLTSAIQPMQIVSGDEPPTTTDTTPASMSETDSTPTSTAMAAPTGKNWEAEYTAVLAEVRSELQKPDSQQNWPPIIARLQVISDQHEAPYYAQAAAKQIVKIQRKGPALVQTATQPQAQPTQPTPTAASIPPTTPAPTPVQPTQSKPARRGFDALGICRPCFTLPAGPYGLRFQLEDPNTRRVRAYIEFPTELGVNVSDIVGKYVGVSGDKTQPAGLAAMVIRVEHHTVLQLPQAARRTARENR